jgi:hypothetical protein
MVASGIGVVASLLLQLQPASVMFVAFGNNASRSGAFTPAVGDVPESLLIFDAFELEESSSS